LNQPPAHAPANRLLSLIGLALLALCTVIVYHPGIGGGFVFDDLPNIVDNRELHVSRMEWGQWITAAFSSPASSIQRPLAMLTFAANIYFTGLDAAAMKWTNIFIHCINACLVFFLSRQVLQASHRGGAIRPGPKRLEWAAYATAAAWALHPINLMAVLFVVQRMESLCHTFVFAGLILYCRGRRRMIDGRGGWLAPLMGLVLATGIGVLVKESAALVPLYALFLEIFIFRFEGGNGIVDRRLKALYLVIVGAPAIAATVWLWPRFQFLGTVRGRDFSILERLLTEARVLVDYLQWTVMPRLGELGLYHDQFPISRGIAAPISTLFAIIFLVGLAVLAWRLRHVRPVVALGIAWFFSAHVLTASVIPLELVFEHRNYFASLGILLALVDILVADPVLPRVRRACAAAVACGILLLACLTFLRATEWSNPWRFSESEALKRPDSPRATYELARNLVILSNYDPGSRFLAPALEAIERARQVDGRGIMPEQAALLVSERVHRPLDPQWWASMQRKLRAQPVTVQTIGALGALTECQELGHCHFPVQALLDTFSAALEQGDHPEVLNIYGSFALNVLHDPRLGLRLWEEAVRLKPGEAQYRINLAELQIALGAVGDAKEQISALRAAGRLGQNELPARELEARIAASARSARNKP
jgi:hypothetical protein